MSIQMTPMYNPYNQAPQNRDAQTVALPPIKMLGSGFTDSIYSKAKQIFKVEGFCGYKPAARVLAVSIAFTILGGVGAAAAAAASSSVGLGVGVAICSIAGLSVLASAGNLVKRYQTQGDVTKVISDATRTAVNNLQQDEEQKNQPLASQVQAYVNQTHPHYGHPQQFVMMPQPQPTAPAADSTFAGV